MVDKVVKKIGGAEAESNALREKILNAQDSLNVRGTVFYVSSNGDDANDGLSPETAVKTFERLSKLPVLPETTVLFERGSVFRIKEPLWATPGVGYGTYGKGEKPKILGSLRDYADPTIWQLSETPNVWSIELKTQERAALTVFNNETYIGAWKYTFDELEKDGDYYHDTEKGIYYLYFEGVNPGEYFDNIEITTTKMAIMGKFLKKVVIDNLCVKYFSFGAFQFAESDEITISNCELGWHGGRIFNVNEKTGKPLLYGNAIEFWYQCSELKVENCWVYQVFDAAMTFQGSGPNGRARFDDIKFHDNLIEYCSMNIEHWVGGGASPEEAHTKDISYKGNIIRFSGYGWGGIYRFDKEDQASLLGWNRQYDDVTNFVISDCILDCADSYMIYLHGPKTQKGMFLSNMTYYQSKVSGTHDCVEIIKGYPNKASNQKEFEEAIALFDENPKLVKWLD